MRLRRVEPVLRRALRGSCAPARPAGESPVRLLVAVSGGADSTATLIGLRNLARELDLDLRAAHLHHGLRGPEADADLGFVRALCDRIGVPLTWARWNTRARMRRRGLSGQAGLRTLRQEFLLRVARHHGARGIVTGHTADDQLETLLMRLARGTGPGGLAGMRPRRGPWLKPLLGATRADVEADLIRAGEPWREDASNRDPRYARNRLRTEAIPALARALAPGLDPVRARTILARRAARAAAGALSSAGALDALSARFLTRAGRIQPDGCRLDRRRMARLPRGLRDATLGRLWRRLRPDSTGLTHRHLDALDGLIDSARGRASIHLPGGWTAERDRDTIRIRGTPRSRVGGRVESPLPGRAEWRGSRVEARWITGAAARRRLVAGGRAGEFFAAEGLAGPLEVRRARPEERFVPFGRTRAARLGRFLNKQGVANEHRQNPTVLADAEGILWVVGVRRSARAPVTAGTRKALWVHAENHD